MRFIILALSLIGFSISTASAEEYRITLVVENNTDYDFVSGKVANREHAQDVDFPATIAKGATGNVTFHYSFDATVHLDIQWTLDGDDETVAVKYKVTWSYNEGTPYPSPSCHTDTPSSISGDHSHCNSSPVTYTFSEAGS